MIKTIIDVLQETCYDLLIEDLKNKYDQYFEKFHYIYNWWETAIHCYAIIKWSDVQERMTNNIVSIRNRDIHNRKAVLLQILFCKMREVEGQSYL